MVFNIHICFLFASSNFPLPKPHSRSSLTWWWGSAPFQSCNDLSACSQVIIMCFCFHPYLSVFFFPPLVYSFNLSASIILFCLLAVSFSLQVFTELPDSWLFLHPQLITIFSLSSVTAKWCLWNPIRIISLCPCLLLAGLPLETSAIIFATVCTL